MFCLLGCAEPELKTYSYCHVDDIQKELTDATWTGRYRVHCDTGDRVVFSRSVKVGDGIYYSPYYEDNDAVTQHGYIHSIDEVVP